jgi:hypothetical protein
MNFLQATVSKKSKAWIDDDMIRIEFQVNETDNITGIVCTKKQEGKTKSFIPVGKDPYALVKMFQEMEQWFGKLLHPSEMKRTVRKVLTKRK